MEKQQYLKKYDWNEDWAVNIETIDLQHRKFLENINNLIDIINKQVCSENITTIFFSLVHFAENFFTKEEMLLKNYKYPNLSEHIASHKNFIQQIIIFQEEFKNKQPKVCLNLYEFLESWLTNHILEYDKKAIDFLHEKIIE